MIESVQSARACFMAGFRKLSVPATTIAGLILVMSCTAFAEPADFEIDLKDLPAARPGKSLPAQRSNQRPESAKTAVAPGEFSRYTVRSGDHLFLILIRHFGLSNQAAERLIPEVMHINGIHDPRGLQIGQHLKIPLPPRPEKTSGRGSSKPFVAAHPPTGAVMPARHNDNGLETGSTHKEVIVTAAPSCTMARQAMEGMGLLAPPFPLLQGNTTFTTSHAGLTVVVACQLPAPEIYTYQRLLAPYEVQLLSFDGEEPPRRVIEKLANRLGLRYQLLAQTDQNTLPLTYLFEAVGPDRREVRLTIRQPLPDKGNTPVHE